MGTSKAFETVEVSIDAGSHNSVKMLDGFELCSNKINESRAFLEAGVAIIALRQAGGCGASCLKAEEVGIKDMFHKTSWNTCLGAICKAAMA